MFKIISAYDGNDEVFLSSTDKVAALFEALEILGYRLVEDTDDDDEDEEDC